MRGYLLILIAVLLASSVNAAEIDGFVNDEADVLDAATVAELNAIGKQIYDSGEAEYAIVILDSLEGTAIESYSLDLAQGKLGDSEKNNGLLLLIAISDRQYRFEVGRGIEYILNDAKVGRIGRQYLQPNFKEGNYDLGVLESSLAVRSILLGDNASEYYVTGEEEYEVNNLRLYFNLFLFIFIFILPILAAILKKKKSDNKYFNAAAGAVILFGGPRGRGGSGGGFGGFGGGGFGGGGASGGW